MKIMPNPTTKRNQRIAANLRRVQGHVAAIERSLAEDPNGSILFQRVAAAPGAVSGLMAYLLEERLRSLQPDGEGGDTIEEMIEIVRDCHT
jgi:DNA-binding FrmR family transcriptional regulator